MDTLSTASLEDLGVTASPPTTPAENTNHINISGDVVTRSTGNYPDEHRSLVRWLFTHARTSHWTWDEAARLTGISTTTLYRVWTGKYINSQTKQPISLDGVCDQIARAKTLIEERASADRLPFVLTGVARRIFKAADEARVMQTFAFVYGESQIGKTCCLQEYSRRHNHGDTPYVLTPASGGVQTLAKAMAAALGISPHSCFDRLRDRIAAALDPNKLIILDEIHEAFLSYQKTSVARCMSMLRQWQETSQCGMLLCGTNAFRNELERGEFAQALKQLRKRGIWEVQLEDVPTDADLLLIARHYKLDKPTGDDAQLVAWIAKEFGLGKYTKFLARACKLAKDRSQRMSWSHFTEIVRIADSLRTRPTKLSH